MPIIRGETAPKVAKNLNSYIDYCEGRHPVTINAFEALRDLHEGYLLNDLLFSPNLPPALNSGI
jgi:hypothetical protein